MISGTNLPLALWLLHEAEIDQWRAAQSPLARQWLVEQHFKGEKHRVVLFPDASGGLPRPWRTANGSELSLWHGRD